MNRAVQEEYERALRRAIYRHGLVVSQQPGIGWMDVQATDHLRACEPYTARDVDEDEWYEFVSMGGPEDGRKHGLTLAGVGCTCGRLEDRMIRWDESVYAVAQAVFEEAFGGRR